MPQQLAFQKASNPPRISDYLKIFLCKKTICSSGNIQLSATEISKVLESCQLVHLCLHILQFLNCKPPIGLHGKYVFTQCASKAHFSGWVTSTTRQLCTMLSLASLTHTFHKCFSQSFAFKSKLFSDHPCSYDIWYSK